MENRGEYAVHTAAGHRTGRAGGRAGIAAILNTSIKAVEPIGTPSTRTAYVRGVHISGFTPRAYHAGDGRNTTTGMLTNVQPAKFISREID